ncbi:uncharacterized protein [Antedon mediterranea]|uniref:uncharacterized protein isoform X2 n=1 Tax=Antedon mediterranea TaxID=105859 RepID=UPI003AF55A4E
MAKETCYLPCCKVSKDETNTIKRKYSNIASLFSEEFADKPVAFGLSMVINTVAKKFKDVPIISTNGVYKWMQKKHQGSEIEDFLICDCRPREEYVVSHLPGAIQLNPDTIDMREVQKVLQQHAFNNKFAVDAKVKVVMYCAVGYRSSALINRYLESQKKKIIDDDHFEFVNMEGSIFKWGNEKRPMVDDQDEITVMVHPFSPVWGKLLFKEIRH